MHEQEGDRVGEVGATESSTTPTSESCCASSSSGCQSNVQKSSCSHQIGTTDTKNGASKQVLEDSDLVRDKITGMLFADPVFCDKGHTHERSCIERHFRARREQKAEEETLRQSQGRAESNQDSTSCVRANNFEPTCPYTNEPISEILIDNDQCDRIVVALVEAGFIEADEEELEDWRTRREEKLLLQRQRREKQQLEAEERPHTHDSAPPEVRIDAETVSIIRPLRCSTKHRHVDLGVAVALCPDDWESTALSINGLVSRCAHLCCRRVLDPQYVKIRDCARCAQRFCSSCVRFQVDRATSRGDEAAGCRHLICQECLWQIRDVIATDAANDDLVGRLDGVADKFFLSLSLRKSKVQHHIIHSEKRKEYKGNTEVLNQEIMSLQERRRSLKSKILAQKGKNSAARKKVEEGPTPNDVATLETKIANLQEAYNAIDWFQMTEKKIVEVSRIEHDLNEATLQLALINSEAVEETMGAPSSKLEALEAQCQETKRQFDELKQEGPWNTCDTNYALRHDELIREYGRLSMEVAQAREELPANPLDTKVAAKANQGVAAHSQEDLWDTKLPAMSPRSCLAATSTNAVAAASTPSLHSTSSTNRSGRASLVNDAKLELAAIGIISIDETLELPLGLNYPSARMRTQVLQLRNALDLAKLTSEQHFEADYAKRLNRLKAQVDALNRELLSLMLEAAEVEEEKLLRERAQKREEEERERTQRRERIRAAEQRRLELQKKRIERRRVHEEQQTRQALRGTDLRCCGRCGFGPIEKYNCNDMAAHNDLYTYIDSNGRRQQKRRNECPECGWTHSDWHMWPRFQP